MSSIAEFKPTPGSAGCCYGSRRVRLPLGPITQLAEETVAPAEAPSIGAGAAGVDEAGAELGKADPTVYRDRGQPRGIDRAVTQLARIVGAPAVGAAVRGADGAGLSGACGHPLEGDASRHPTRPEAHVGLAVPQLSPAAVAPAESLGVQGRSTGMGVSGIYLTELTVAGNRNRLDPPVGLGAVADLARAIVAPAESSVIGSDTACEPMAARAGAHPLEAEATGDRHRNLPAGRGTVTQLAGGVAAP